MATCLYCNQPIFQRGVGRVPVYCSKACKQAHYRLRKNDCQRTRISGRQRQIIENLSREQRNNLLLRVEQPIKVQKLSIGGHEVIFYTTHDIAGAEFLRFDFPQSLTLRNAGDNSPPVYQQVDWTASEAAL